MNRERERERRGGEGGGDEDEERKKQCHGRGRGIIDEEDYPISAGMETINRARDDGEMRS